jgi:hypothetical protein
MGNSTITLAAMYDSVASRGIPDPRMGPSGYGDRLGLEIANAVMADLICDRFNWKWNSAVGAPFYTNSWQQDYPQPKQPAGLIGWGEDCAMIDINNTALPKPMRNPKWRRQLSPTSMSGWLPENLCWMYNGDMTLGAWPGAGVTFYPLVGTGLAAQNPLMNMLDANGNILSVTAFGVTGGAAPQLPANSAEGLTVVDGTVTWTCVSATSQGFRIDRLPSATGVVQKIIATYQLEPPIFANMAQTLNPVPDSYARYFRRGLEAECLSASPNPGDMKRGEAMKVDWLNAMMQSKKQGDRELNIYSLLPAHGVVEERWGEYGPYTADRPY